MGNSAQERSGLDAGCIAQRLDNGRHMAALLERYPVLDQARTSIAKAAALICLCHADGGKVLACGNGGSAADAEHIVGELMKGFVLPRPLPQADIEGLRRSAAGYGLDPGAVCALQRGVPAVALTGAGPLATAISNDINPDMVFAQQVYALGKPGDVLIGLTTSGRSRNVLAAFAVARHLRMRTVLMTGDVPPELDSFADVVLRAPAKATHHVQELHLPVYHTICLMVEEELFGGLGTCEGGAAS